MKPSLRQIIFDLDQNRYSFVHCLYFCTPSIFEVGKTQLGGSTSQSVNLEPYPSRGLKYFFSFSTFSDKFRKKLLANYPPLCISSETKTLTQQYFNWKEVLQLDFIINFRLSVMQNLIDKEAHKMNRNLWSNGSWWKSPSPIFENYEQWMVNEWKKNK